MKHLLTSFALASLGFLLLSAPVQAQTTRFVDTLNGSDTGDCTDQTNPCASISYTIGESSEGDSILIAEGVYTESLEIDHALNLHGEDEETTIIQRHALPGGALGRVITINGDGNFEAEIADLTIRHGKITSGAFPENMGGGIYAEAAMISLTDVTLSNNEARNAGGLGVLNALSTLDNVTFVENSAEIDGGGMVEAIEVQLQGTTMSLSGYLHGEVGDGTSTLTNLIFNNNTAGRHGGGYRGFDSSPTLSNVMFNGNVAELDGGGLYNDNSSPTLTDISLFGNAAFGTEADEGGGGMFTVGDESLPVLTRVAFDENSAVRGAGLHVIGVEGSGGAMLRDVEFRENEATSIGGGMYVRESAPNLVNVAFTGNSADITAGGMFSVDGAPTLTNVTFSGNAAHSPESAHGAGGMRNLNSSPTLTNVTFSGNNSGASGGGMINSGESAPVLSNVVFWDNQANGSTTSASASIFNLSSTSTPAISHSLIANSGGSANWEDAIGVDGGNNIDVDPLFLEPIDPVDAPTTLGNFRLTEGSPAIDAGGPGTDPLIFPTDDNGDPIDLLGNPRFFGAIDMGPFEWNPNVADEAGPDGLVEVLTAPYPNPARGSTTFTVAVARAQDVTVEVFDALGRRVQTLYDGALAAGTEETLTLDAAALPAGVYIIRAAGEDLAETQRVTVIR